jgi:hypothetical protein
MARASKSRRHTVLIINEVPPGRAPPDDAEILSDGWLGFERLALRTRQLGDVEAPQKVEVREEGGRATEE